MIIHGDALEELKKLASKSVACCVTSPPYYGLRDYGVPGQLGLEDTPEAYITKLVEIFREVRRVLKDDGTLWLNLGDSYSAGGMSNPSSKSTLNGGKDRGADNYTLTRKTDLAPKNLLGIPWRVALALQADGWYLRSDIIWHKPNAMPESVKDRPTKAHEYVFLLCKSERYYYDAEAIKEELIAKTQLKRTSKNTQGNGQLAKSVRFGSHPEGKNKRTVWSVPTQPYREAHFAVMPTRLVEPCILAGTRPGDVVLDPFCGAGTVPYVASQHGRQYIGIELNPDYIDLIYNRLGEVVAV